LQGPAPDAFAQCEPELRHVISEHSNLAPDDVHSLLLSAARAPESRVAKLITRLCAETMLERGMSFNDLPVEDVIQIAASSPRVLKTIDYSSLSVDALRRILVILANQDEESRTEAIRSIVNQELQRGWSELIDTLYGFFPDVTTALVLERLQSGHYIGERWTRPIANHMGAVAKWLRQKSPARGDLFREISRALKRSYRASEKDLNEWRALLSEMAGGEEKDPAAFVIGLLLAIRPNNTTSLSAGRLLLESFDVVDQALASGILDSWEWDALADHLPSLGWWDDWDHWKRFRLGVVSAARKYGFSIWDVMSVVTDEQRRKEFQRLSGAF
jgi:hypothetical protein